MANALDQGQTAEVIELARVERILGDSVAAHECAKEGVALVAAADARHPNVADLAPKLRVRLLQLEARWSDEGWAALADGLLAPQSR